MAKDLRATMDYMRDKRAGTLDGRKWTDYKNQYAEHDKGFDEMPKATPNVVKWDDGKEINLTAMQRAYAKAVVEGSADAYFKGMDNVTPEQLAGMRERGAEEARRFVNMLSEFKEAGIPVTFSKKWLAMSDKRLVGLQGEGTGGFFYETYGAENPSKNAIEYVVVGIEDDLYKRFRAAYNRAHGAELRRKKK